MNAVSTALDVLHWATCDTGPPPRGTLREPERLLADGARLGPAVRQLLAVTSARLRLGSPPLGDTSALTPAPTVLAAVLGGRDALDGDLAEALLAEVVGRAASVNDLVARHGVVAPALPYLTEALADECRRASPLTVLLDRPPAGGAAEALAVAARLHRYPRWRARLALALAEPSGQTDVLRWRAELLNRFRGDPAGRGVPFVLDVYEATMVFHADRAMALVHEAQAVLDDPRAMADDARLGWALAVADWWGPLGAVQRSHGGELRARRYLEYDYRKGVALYQRARAIS